VRVAVADDLEVDVVTCPPSCERRGRLLTDSCPVAIPCMVSAVTPWAAWMVVA
jgi:hypothetical protein